MTEYDERVLDNQKINYGIYIEKNKVDPGLDDEDKKVNTMPLHLGSFLLSNKKRNMINFLHAIDGFSPNDLYYEDTDSMYIWNKHWENLGKAGLNGKNRLPRKNDYKDWGIWYSLFLALKTKCF